MVGGRGASHVTHDRMAIVAALPRMRLLAFMSVLHARQEFLKSRLGLNLAGDDHRPPQVMMDDPQRTLEIRR